MGAYQRAFSRDSPALLDDPETTSLPLPKSSFPGTPLPYLDDPEGHGEEGEDDRKLPHLDTQHIARQRV